MYENAQALQMSGEVNGCRSGLLLLIAGRRILSAKIFRICTADQTGQRLKDEKASNNGGLLGCRRQNSAVTRQQMAKVAVYTVDDASNRSQRNSATNGQSSNTKWVQHVVELSGKGSNSKDKTSKI